MSTPLLAHPPADFQTQIENVMKGSPGGIAAAWADGDGTEFFQTGTFSPGDLRPITPDTQFEVGSISKVFTSLLLAQSEIDGRVSRSDPAAKYLLPASDPDQARLAKITLLSLSTHTSGLPRLPTNIGRNPDASANPYADYDRAMLVEGLRTNGPGAPAGLTMAYSNFGASVLGEALAGAWGVSYQDALRQHILVPLGLQHTNVGITGVPPSPELAPVHANGSVVPAWTFQACAGAGGIRSSARDMARFLAACLKPDSTPMGPAIRATLVAQHDSDSGGHVGLGWMINDQSESVAYWHNGATAGSHAFVAFVPSTGTGLVLLCNSQVALEGAAWNLLGIRPPHPKVEHVKSAADYVGRYPLSPAFAIDVRDNGGVLTIQATNQPSFLLRPTGADSFLVTGVPAAISFGRNASGAVVALILHQNGVDQRAPRGELPPPPNEVSLGAEALKAYAGNYALTPGFVITVTAEGDHLYAQATGQGRFEIYASSKDEFFYKVVNAQISFRRGPSGAVTGIVLHQNGRDAPAPRAGPQP